jgi:uncharacterized protein (DUF362 family)
MASGPAAHPPRAVVVSDRDLDYPAHGGRFSPSEQYPEYPFQDRAPNPNRVYAAIRRLLRDAKLDEDNYGTPRWNPLGAYIKPACNVFVLCNFVQHRRAHESRRALHAKCTHAAVIRAVVDFIAIAAGPGATIRIGNSPLQSCDWSNVLHETGTDEVVRFYQRKGFDITATDLRHHVIRQDMLGRRIALTAAQGLRSPVEIDLGSRSLLAEVAGGNGRSSFRIDDYDPRRIGAHHSGTSHRYVLAREVLEADVVVSIAKIKTHEKVGVTCGLKGFVGAVAHKDCLAHYRFGNPGRGGDEYRDRHGFLLPVSHLLDRVNSRSGSAAGQGVLQMLVRSVQRGIRLAGVSRGGAWSGNDTAWRMALDLAYLLHNADASGTVTDACQRTHLAFLDGVIAGEGNGPLAPNPVDAKTLVFSDDVALGDRVACRLMGFDPDVFPLLREAAWRLSSATAADTPSIICNGIHCAETQIRPVLGRRFRLPRGWREIEHAPTQEVASHVKAST